MNPTFSLRHRVQADSELTLPSRPNETQESPDVKPSLPTQLPRVSKALCIVIQHGDKCTQILSHLPGKQHCLPCLTAFSTKYVVRHSLFGHFL